MSCTISELPSGCRLRGIGGSGLQNAANAPLMSGGDISGSTSVGPSAIHMGINNTIQETPRLQQSSQKSCCLCWCCCCSCSWAKCLAIKNAEDNGPTKRNPGTSDLFLDGEQPTIEEIQGWGKNFDSLMKSSSGRKVFRDFLRCEYSEENILFWLACEDLKKETNSEVIEEKARFIYEEYISILSPKEVSLDSRVREIVNQNMVEPTPNTFDEAQIQIYTLMHRDSYPRFINSQLFKSLAQFSEVMSTSGSTADIAT